MTRKKTQTAVPDEPLRRSERNRTQPKWMEDYHTSSVTPPIDPWKDALNKLLMSGILSSVSVDIANKMWEAVKK